MVFDNILNLEKISQAFETYGSDGPFDHCIIDNFFTEDIARKLSDEMPDFDSDLWHSYNNAIEVKRVCNNWNVFPKTTYRIFEILNSQAFLTFLQDGISPDQTLYADPGLNGGGWHIHKRGGKLNTHLDYSLHPKLGKQRKLNIIIYLNPDWQKNWGGSLGFWGNESSDQPGDLIKQVWSKFNRAVIFDTTQNSWHGLPEPLTCPENQYRKSMATYYLVDPPHGVDERGKALFAPTEAQKHDDEVLSLIKKRSSVATASSVYK